MLEVLLRMASLRPTLTVRPIEHDSFFVVSFARSADRALGACTEATSCRCLRRLTRHLLPMCVWCRRSRRQGRSRALLSTQLHSHALAPQSHLCALHCCWIARNVSFGPSGSSVVLLGSQMLFSVARRQDWCQLPADLAQQAAGQGHGLRGFVAGREKGGKNRTRWEREGWPLPAALPWQGPPSSGRHGSKVDA